MKRVMVSVVLWLVAVSTLSFAQTSRSDLPAVVARVKLVGQTHAVSERVIFTPKSSGLFRIAGVLMVTTAGGNGSWSASLAWHDFQDEGTPFDGINTNKLGSNWASFVFAAQQGTPVKFAVDAAGDVSGSVYDAIFVIERLTKIPAF